MNDYTISFYCSATFVGCVVPVSYFYSLVVSPYAFSGRYLPAEVVPQHKMHLVIKTGNQHWQYPYPDPEPAEICPLEMGKLTKSRCVRCPGKKTIQAEHAEGKEPYSERHEQKT